MMKNVLVLILVFCCNLLLFQQGTLAQKNPYGLSEKDVEWMREATIQQLEGCRVKGASDTWIHTPDGIRNYKALWTRDYYYMVEYAGDLMDPKEILASIYYLLNGQREDGCIPDRVNISGKAVIKYGDRAEEVKEAFQQRFYDPETGVVSSGSQTSYAMSLYTGILPEQDNEKVYNKLIGAIKQNDYALTAGDIGYHFLVRVLSEKGRSDILYKMNNRSDKPGYGLQIKKGATSLTESWAALPNVSNLHMMLGHLMEWFYSGLGGIYQADNSIGYRNIIIAPKPVGEINWAKCSYNSHSGLIVSDWELEGKAFSLTIEVPRASRAKVIIPADYQDSTIEVVNSTDERPEDVEIIEGALDVASGRYKIYMVKQH